jgi:hypothetical protein
MNGYTCTYCGQRIEFGWNNEQLGECEHNPKPCPHSSVDGMGYCRKCGEFVEPTLNNKS